MKKYNLTKINYEYFRRFLDSSMDELSFFGTSTEDYEPLELYLKRCDRKRREFSFSTQVYSRIISKVNDLEDTCLTRDDILLIGGVYLKKKKNGFSSGLKYSSDEGLIDNLKDKHYNRKMVRQLNDYSLDELQGIYDASNNVFSDCCGDRTTVSDIFLVKNDFNKNFISLNTGSFVRPYVESYSRDKELRYNCIPYAMVQGLPTFFDKFSKECLSEDDCKRLVKKLYVKK